MSFADALPYVSHCLDDALCVRTLADMPEERRVRLIGWQCGYEPMFVAIWSYLGGRLADDEAVAIAKDYLTEIGWFADAAADNEPDFIL